MSVLLLTTAWHIAAHAYDKLQHSLSLYTFPSVASWTGACVPSPMPPSLPAARLSDAPLPPPAPCSSSSCLIMISAVRGGHVAGGLAAAPTLGAVAAAVASIVVKELLYQVRRQAATTRQACRDAYADLSRPCVHAEDRERGPQAQQPGADRERVAPPQ